MALSQGSELIFPKKHSFFQKPQIFILCDDYKIPYGFV
ncbi:hypothetical protein ADICYQ_3924 [Cyclobacterium qasimii M12-11B]|uniref:Uncharacterized protein n=1 Tax=Cyclobacterium qasimii M12-11B TaxID=641524 RepID=S7WK12_9BACT|nr:hypothetical protein ADICYQ_3924 [Cyclobacterium qasimii M12-11B]